MDKAELVESIESRFDKKEYEKILHILDQKKQFVVSEIHSELDVRLCLLAAYTYYYVEMYNQSLECSVKLFDFMIRSYKFRKESDVLEGLAIIIIDSLHKIDRRIKAFFFSRRLIKKMRWSHSEIQQYYLNYKETLSQRLVDYLNYSVIGVMVCVVLAQRLFSFLDRPFYLLLIIVGLLSLAIVLFARKFVIRLINSLL